MRATVIVMLTLLLGGGASLGKGDEQPMKEHREVSVKVPKIAGEFVHVYKPEGDVFPGPTTAGLVPGQYYEDWVPNDHCFIRDHEGRWHAFGITHPLTPLQYVHAGEYQSFHALAPKGTLKDVLKARTWKDQPKVLTAAERPGESPPHHAPYIIRRDDLYYMIYGPGGPRVATSKDLYNWTQQGGLNGCIKGGKRDPSIFLWNGTYHVIACAGRQVKMGTSKDFNVWEEQKPILTLANTDAESPSIIRYNGTFYLFTSIWAGGWDRKEISGAYPHITHVYQSDNPLDFNNREPVAMIDGHAPEIFQDEEGDWYISSVEWPHRGVSIARLEWE